MATQPAFLRKNEAPAGPLQGVDAANRTSRMRAVRDPFQLRALPHEHLFLFNKKIDNTRLVREADPKSRGACWSAIGAACVLDLEFGGVDGITLIVTGTRFEGTPRRETRCASALLP